MYSGGHSLNDIAKKFDRTPASIQKLISSMGVHRGDDVFDTEQQPGRVVESDKPVEKEESKLKKPWYLKK